MSPSQSEFAPGEKTPDSILRQQARKLLDVELLEKLYEAVNEMVLILNGRRQIVFCNTRFAELVGYSSSRELIGMGPGDALSCMNVCESGACGTGEFCSTCGALRAILNSQNGKADVQECRIVRSPRTEALDLLVRTTPLVLSGEEFTIFAATDISDEKRRRALERVFFHDVMNTATAIQMISDNINRAGSDKIKEVASLISEGLQQLVDEIASQRDLAQAENNELSVRPAELSSQELLLQIRNTYESLARNRNCELAISPEIQNTVFRNDPRILSRVIGNMIKNALEACGKGQRITLTAKSSDGFVSFSVHNPGYIPRNVQSQIFKRSFSTKGAGRGLGTYSMKLLTENYLQGKVTFSSSEAAGTTFTVTLRL